MLACDYNEKIFQTLPGQGWRVIIEWDFDMSDDLPAMTLEPVVAWVTAKLHRSGKRGPYDEVVIAPMVRWPAGDELLLLDTRGSTIIKKVTYLAPGDEPSTQQSRQLNESYAKGVVRG